MGVSFIGPTQAFSASVTGTTAVQSKSYDVRRYSLCSFQVVFVGTLNATFQVLGSNDGINFDDTGAFVQPAVGANGHSIANIAPGYAYIQFQITPTSGTSTVTVTFAAKEG